MNVPNIKFENIQLCSDHAKSKGKEWKNYKRWVTVHEHCIYSQCPLSFYEVLSKPLHWVLSFSQEKTGQTDKSSTICSPFMEGKKSFIQIFPNFFNFLHDGQHIVSASSVRPTVRPSFQFFSGLFLKNLEILSDLKEGIFRQNELLRSKDPLNLQHIYRLCLVSFCVKWARSIFLKCYENLNSSPSKRTIIPVFFSVWSLVWILPLSQFNLLLSNLDGEFILLSMHTECKNHYFRHLIAKLFPWFIFPVIGFNQTLPWSLLKQASYLEDR